MRVLILKAVLKRISKHSSRILSWEAQEVRLPGEEEEKEEVGVNELDIDQQGHLAYLQVLDQPLMLATPPLRPSPTLVAHSHINHPSSLWPHPVHLTPLPPSAPPSLETPTIPEGSTTEHAAVNFLPCSQRYAFAQHIQGDTISIAGLSPPSVAPSEMSVQWFRSPRERLGLGGPHQEKQCSALGKMTAMVVSSALR